MPRYQRGMMNLNFGVPPCRRKLRVSHTFNTFTDYTFVFPQGPACESSSRPPVAPVLHQSCRAGAIAGG
jgi:hypothetical protein